jgi:hypothetical protein
MSTDDHDPKEFSDSDREWFAALSGNASRDSRSTAALEGAALRVALELRRQEIDSDPRLAAVTSDTAMEAMRQNLVQRARDEGLFDRTAPATPPPSAGTSNVVEFPWWRRRRPLLALAASVLVGLVTVRELMDRPDYPEPPEMLGTGGVLRVRAPQPRAAAEQLAARLKQADLRPGLYQRGKTYFVEVQLMAAELSAARPAFEALGIEAGVGFNRVAISPL